MDRKPTITDSLIWGIRELLGKGYKTKEDARIYDSIARHYYKREWIAEKIAETFNKYLPPHISQRYALILDRAAGTGIVTEALLAQGFRVRASDISKTQLEILKSKYPKAVTVLEDLNSKISNVQDNSVFGITQVAATRYFTPEGQKLLISESYKKLIPEGILIWPVFRSEILMAKIKGGRGLKCTSFSISGLLKKSGFDILEIRTLRYSFLKLFQCKLLVAKKTNLIRKSNMKQ
ncbi:MAG: methyltransferase domain-containing protein [Patescibacteria group bacterium]